MDIDNQTLFSACECGDLAKVKQLIDDGYEVDARNMMGFRSTHFAARHGHTKCLDYFLSIPGVDPNWTSYEDETALMLASVEGKTTCLHSLLKHGADPNICNNMLESPLSKSVEKNHVQCVELLLEYGADVNKSQFNQQSPLHVAVYRHNVRLAKMLIEHGADIGLTEDYNLTPLFVAAQFSDLDCLNLLIHEAQKQKRVDLVNKSADDGATPLYLAAQNGHTDCVRSLLRAGADPNQVTSCSPRAVALYAAIQLNQFECVRLLLPRTDCTVFSKCDVTPFEIATRCGDHDPEILQYLVDNIKDYHIDTLIDGDTHDKDIFFPRTTDLYPGVATFLEALSITSLTSMILGYCRPKFVEIMLNAGASPNGCPTRDDIYPPKSPLSLDKQLFISKTLPPICISGQIEILKLLLANGAVPNIYAKNVPYNLTVFFSLHSQERLAMLLRYGAETTSCFHVKEEYLKTVPENSIFPPTFAEAFAGLQHRWSWPQIKVESTLRLLLEFTTSPGYISTIIDTIENDKKEKIKAIMTNASSLAHICRVKIREYLAPKNLKRSVLLSSLNLPTVVCDFILYKGIFDTVTSCVEGFRT